MIISKEERVCEALGCRLGEFCFQQDKVGKQVSDLTTTLVKLNYEYSEKLSELSTIKSCIRKLDRSKLDNNELEISKKIYSSQETTVRTAIEYLEVYIDSTTRKIEELRMVYEDLALDIDAIDGYLEELKKNCSP